MSDSSDAENEVIEKTLKDVEFIQTMIDSTAKLLLGLRNECAATNDLTQNEIREQEVSTWLILSTLELSCHPQALIVWRLGIFVLKPRGRVFSPTILYYVPWF
jgi:hypothetical protein